MRSNDLSATDDELSAANSDRPLMGGLRFKLGIFCGVPLLWEEMPLSYQQLSQTMAARPPENYSMRALKGPLMAVHRGSLVQRPQTCVLEFSLPIGLPKDGFKVFGSSHRDGSQEHLPGAPFILTICPNGLLLVQSSYSGSHVCA
jgi:hypothetical protein